MTMANGNLFVPKDEEELWVYDPRHPDYFGWVPPEKPKREGKSSLDFRIQKPPRQRIKNGERRFARRHRKNW